MLTRSQQHALETTHHLSVTANAGSGKTLVLVERYVSLIVSGKAHVSEVVAITFTEKAASELKSKIATKVAERVAVERDPQARVRLEELREELSGALIDTIHSFCSRILREYPVEADVDAAFSVLEEIDRRVFLEAAVKETFETILSNKHRGIDREALLDLLRSLGKKKVLDAVYALVNKREVVDRWLCAGGLFARSDEEVLTFWRSTLTDAARRELEDPSLAHNLHLLAEAVKGTERRAVSAALAAFFQSTALYERLSALDRLIDAMLTKKGELRKKVFSGSSLSLEEAATCVQDRRHRIQPLSDEDDAHHRDLLRQTRLLLDVYRDVIERYSQAKAEHAFLDFDDLQLRTKMLLTNEKVRQKLSQRFKYIMVDEYQDTNLLQYEILLPLLSDLSKGNLCIVGDPKQSIYGFRDADVTVFNRTKRDILQASGPESAVTLGESFRPLRDVAAFINLLFSSVMKDEDEVSYEPLICGRQNDAPGRVELLVPPSPDPTATDAMSQEEMIARRILQLRNDRYTIFGKEETPHPIRFKDIAILLRSRTGLDRLEQALLRNRVPYMVSGGVGYFQTQAVYDFFHYCRFLLNAEDDVALVGILRSPFFNVSDAELLEFRLKKNHGSWWDAMTSSGSSLDRFPALVRAAAFLREDLEVAARLTVPELIDRIMEQTAYVGFAAGMPRAGQMLANIEKLKRVAREYADRGFTTLYDFTARLQRLIDEQEEEGQALVDVDADAVRIMTIHSAKGLEFPVVVLPSLERTFLLDKEPFVDEQLGLAVSPAEKDKQSIPIVEFVKKKARAKTVAEEKRVFYVACTRARDLLVLSASAWVKPSSNCLSWLVTALEFDPDADVSQISFDVRTACLRVCSGQYEAESVAHQLPVYVVRPRDLAWTPTVEVSEERQPEPPVRVHLEPILAGEGNEVFSASKIRTYVECPSKYYLRYVAGLPGSTVRLFNDRHEEDEADVDIPRDLRGRAFHHVMQHIETIGDDRSKIRQELKQFIARDSYSILAEPSIELDALTDTVLEVMHSEFWKELQRGSESRTEFTIAARLDQDILLGTLDRVYRDSDGVWTVLDFKTDSVTDETRQEKIEQYEPQIKFYALLIRKFFSCSRVRACILFSELVEKPARFEFTSSDLEAHEQQVRSIIARIRAGEFKRNGRPCSVCPFLPTGCKF